MTYKIEKDWVTEAGFRAVVIMGDLGFRCGYVGLPQGHKLHGVSYSQETEYLVKIPNTESVGKRGIMTLFLAGVGDGIPQSPEMVFDVHGSLTYSAEYTDYPVKSDGLWWFGFDCGHAGDGRSAEYLQEQKEKYPTMPFMWGEEDVCRSLEYCIEECESLARQVVQKTITNNTVEEIKSHD